MKIIISPAKKMNIDLDSLAYDSLPDFLEHTHILFNQLKKLDYKQAKSLWKCNDNIAKSNYTFLHKAELTRSLTPAILSYEGIQYKYMAPEVFNTAQLEYIQQHLRIISGFYGILRPFDGVVPYRLEMQAKLKGEGFDSLYSFWAGRIADKLKSETGTIINLASKEYSTAICPYLPDSFEFITCIFGEIIDGRVVEKGTMCKMARGEMVRFMAENNVKTKDGIKQFNVSGYRFSTEHSNEKYYTFIKEKK